MIRSAFLLLMVFSVSLAFSQNTDEEAVKQVVNSAYIDGIHNGGDIEAIRKGFHPAFNMLRLIDNEVKPLPIEEWISNIEKSRAKETKTQSRAEAKFLNVHISGNAAVVELDLYRDGKKTFTDYLSLYKFTEGWRIVSKIYYRH